MRVSVAVMMVLCFAVATGTVFAGETFHGTAKGADENEYKSFEACQMAKQNARREVDLKQGNCRIADFKECKCERKPSYHKSNHSVACRVDYAYSCE